MWMCSSLRFCRLSCGLSSGVAKGMEISVSGTPERRPSVVSFRGGREPLPLQNGPREADTCSGRSSLLRFPPRDELLKFFLASRPAPGKRPARRRPAGLIHYGSGLVRLMDPGVESGRPGSLSALFASALLPYRIRRSATASLRGAAQISDSTISRAPLP